MGQALSEELRNRVLVQTLALTTSQRSTGIDIIASHARCTVETAKRILDSVNVDCVDGRVSIPVEARLQLAREASQGGLLTEVARKLDWREFESFIEWHLIGAGFKVRKNLRIRNGGRLREVDIVAARRDLVLCIDCKHWNTPSYRSRLRGALIHQLEATRNLLSEPRQGESAHVSGLPLVLTLHEPPEKILDGVVLLSASQLPSFLEGLTELSESLPFIYPDSQDRPKTGAWRKAFRTKKPEPESSERRTLRSSCAAENPFKGP